MREPSRSSLLPLLLTAELLQGCAGASVNRTPDHQPDRQDRPAVETRGNDSEADGHSTVRRLCWDCQEQLVDAAHGEAALLRVIASTAVCIQGLGITGKDDNCRVTIGDTTVRDADTVNTCTTSSRDTASLSSCIAEEAFERQGAEREADRFLANTGKCERKNEETVLQYLKGVCVPAVQKARENIKKLKAVAIRLQEHLAQLRASTAERSAKSAKLQAEQNAEQRARTEAEEKARKAQKEAELGEIERTLKPE